MTAATVDDAVQAHVGWITAQAAVGGATWSDGPLQWAWVEPQRTVHALFPEEFPAEAIARGLDAAQVRGADHVVVWSAADRPAPTLKHLGFEVGWQPCWMGAYSAHFDDAIARLTRRASLSTRVRRPDDAWQPLLERADVRRAEATASGRYAGRAWVHVTGEVAGLFDMAVWPAWRRQGFGRDLVQLVGSEAHRMGADRVVLNATPEGELLYTACGFEHLGSGRTWWWHRPRQTQPAD